MSRVEEKLESLSPSVRFSAPNPNRSQKVTHKTSIDSFFLQKRERLESEDFGELLAKRHRGLSDAILPEGLSFRLEGFRRHRSSVVGPKEQLLVDPIDLLTEEPEATEGQKVEQTKVERRQLGRRRKEHEGFNFNEFTSKKSKEIQALRRSAIGRQQTASAENRKARRKIPTTGEEDHQPDSSSNLNGPENDPETQHQGSADEKNRLRTKLRRVNMYWRNSTLHIPNVFRLARLIEEDSKSLLEFQDYSSKSVLVNGINCNNVSEHPQSLNNEQSEPANDAVSFMHRQSFNVMLSVPEDILNMLK